MKKIMSVLLALSMLMAMVVLPVTAEGVEDLSATVHFAEQWQGYSNALAAQDKGVLTNNLSATNGTKFMLHSDAPFTYKRMKCNCEDGIDCAVLAVMKAADVHIKYTKNEDMLNITFSDVVKNWGGADHNCVYATAIPTAEAVAGSVVEGAMWYEYEDHKTEEFPFAFTLIESASHVVHTDTSFANNFGSGVLPAMNVQLAAGKTMSVAMCTTWWTEGQYTAEPIALTPEFTQGAGLVTMNVANAAYPEVWDSADCSYLNIVPTDAGRAITEDTVVAGSCTLINRNGDAVPLQFTITLLSSMDFQEWGIADAWTAMAEKMLAMGNPAPIAHTFQVNEETVGFKTILHSSWHFTKCCCGAENCDQMGNINNLKSRVDLGAELVTLSLEKVYHEAWAQECTFITLVPTEAAKQAAGTFPVQGVFYYESEDGIHKSAQYAFNFQLQVEVSEPEEPEEPEVIPEILADMPYQASAAIEAMIGGAAVSPITAEIRADAQYRGLLFRTAMLPYIPCANDGNNCSGVAGMGLENLKVMAQTNGELVEFSAEIAAYDEGWGDCFYLYINPTEAAKAAEDGTQITGEIYLENESHKTVGIPFVFTLKNPTEAPEEPEEPEVIPEILADMPYQASAAIEAMIGGAAVSPITAEIRADAKYRGLLFRTAMLPYIPCANDGNNCSGVAGMGLENLKVMAQTNGELVEFSAEIAAYDEGWGDCFYLYINPTEAAKAAEDGTQITGEIYLENESHKTVGIPFVFTLKNPTEAPEEPEEPEVVPPEILSDMPTQAAAAIEAMIGGAAVSPITAEIRADAKYRGLLFRTAMLPYIPCANDGNNCGGIAGMGLENLKVVAQTNGELVEFSAEIAAYDGGGWGDCFYLYINPTEAAKAAEDGSQITGEIYLENESHKTVGIPFVFILRNSAEEPPQQEDESDLTILSQMPFQASDAVQALIDGAEVKPIEAQISADAKYRGLLMRTAMLPYIPCQNDGGGCGTIISCNADNLKIEVKTNSELVEFSTKIAAFDGDGWGQCFYVYVTPTEAAKSATAGAVISGEIYFEKDGHKTGTIPFNFTLEKAENIKPEPIRLENLPYQASAIIEVQLTGGEFTPVNEVVKYGNTYRGIFVRTAMLPFMPCTEDGKDCQELKNCSLGNLVINVKSNGHLIDFNTELAQYDGGDWGKCFYLCATPTEAAKDAAAGTAVTGELYFKTGSHKSRPIPFIFFLEEKDESKISSVSVEPPVEASKGTASGVKLDQLPFQVDGIINAQREGQSVEPIQINVDPQNHYVGLLMTKAMLPFLPCSAHGKDCSEMQSLTPDHLKNAIGANADLVSKLWFEVADYDGWGESIYLHIEFTEKAMQAAPGTQIPVELHFAANGAKTLPINLIFNIAVATESSDVKLDQLPFQVDGVINALRESQSVEPIQIVVDPQNNYMGLLMTKAMLPFVPCNAHGKDCSEMQSLTPDHLKSVIGANADLVNKLWFEVADYDGWGESIYLHIEFTERAMQAEQGTQIPVELYFEDNGIRTVSINLDFFIGEMPENAGDEEPTETPENIVDHPEQLEQEVPRIVVDKNHTLLVVLAVMAGVLLVALIAAIVLTNKKKK